jgi:hypothetical protein
MASLFSYLLIGWLKLLRWSCRLQRFNDPRAGLQREGRGCLFGALHAHQLAITVYAEPGTGAMVSRSKDGDLIARVLEHQGVVPIRGSGGPRRKGGATAWRAMFNHLQTGRPGFLAVDGPKGPRGVVHPGIAMLAQKTNTPVVPLSFVPSRRIIVTRAWDRIQIPLPFCRIEAHFGDPVEPRQGESVAEFALRIQQALWQLERDTDPSEAARRPLPPPGQPHRQAA